MIDYRALTEPELRQLIIDATSELDRRAALEELPAEAARVADRYARSVEGEPPVPFEPVPHNGHGPGVVVIFDGEEWRNISGAWLAASPAVYPLGWAQQTGLPDDAPPWVPDEDVVAGDLREHDGTIYRCTQAHRTQAGWEPPHVPSLWTPQGA